MDLPEERPHLIMAVKPLLDVRRVLRDQYQKLHKAMQRFAAEDPVCRLPMTAPGVGPLVARTFRTGVDDVARFRHARSVAAHFGLTPPRNQSGELDRGRGISKCGDAGVSWALVEAAGAIMRKNTRSSPLKLWGQSIAKRTGPMRALVAVARRLAAILHRMWTDNTEYRWQAKST